MAEKLGTPVCDPADEFPVAADPCPMPIASPPAQPPESKGSRPLRSVLLSAAALCLGIAIGILGIPRTGDPVAAASPGTGPPGIPAHIAGFAELFVGAHLSGTSGQNDLVLLYPDAPAPSAAGGVWVTRANTVAGSAIALDIWQLTVAAEVLEMVDGAYRSAGIQYFSVTVAQAGEQPVALAAPGRVPAPASASPPEVAARFTETLPFDQQDTVTAFLTAYLTGEGEVARYLASTSGVASFAAAPYTSVDIHSTRADSLGSVRARLTAITANGARQVLEYAMEMTYHAGIWKVVSFAPATHHL